MKSDLPGQKEIMNALQAARKEMEATTSELRISKVLKSKVPRNADIVVVPGKKSECSENLLGNMLD